MPSLGAHEKETESILNPKKCLTKTKKWVKQ
jgi:hypothetical protein